VPLIDNVRVGLQAAWDAAAGVRNVLD
jgi:hypothetical protein